MIKLLMVPYYEEHDPVRREELDLCLALNDKAFDKIVVLCEVSVLGTTKERKPGWLNSGSRWINMDRRQSIQDFIKIVNPLLKGCDIAVLANADIIIDQRALELANEHLKRNQVYCLNRWELATQKLFNVDYSQDTWMFRGQINAKIKNVPFSHPGCDNQLAYNLKEAGYEILNPSLDIRTYHNHQSKKVTKYNSQEYRLPLPYLFVSPHTLEGKPILRIPKNLPTTSIRDKLSMREKLRARTQARRR